MDVGRKVEKFDYMCRIELNKIEDTECSELQLYSSVAMPE
jgi:hypothetical protein